MDHTRIHEPIFEVALDGESREVIGGFFAVELAQNIDDHAVQVLDEDRSPSLGFVLCFELRVSCPS